MDRASQKEADKRKIYLGFSNWKMESQPSNPAILYSIGKKMGYAPILYYQLTEFSTFRSPARRSSLLCYFFRLISRSPLDLGNTTISKPFRTSIKIGSSPQKNSCKVQLSESLAPMRTSSFRHW